MKADYKVRKPSRLAPGGHSPLAPRVVAGQEDNGSDSLDLATTITQAHPLEVILTQPPWLAR